MGNLALQASAPRRCKIGVPTEARSRFKRSEEPASPKLRPPSRFALRRDILRMESGAKAGGEAGIRTLDTGFGPYNGLANRRLQPLGHLTVLVFLTISAIRRRSILM